MHASCIYHIICMYWCGVTIYITVGSRTGHLLEPISEERAMRCLQRIDLLFAVREELLPHSNFDELITLCEPSFEVPHWWIPVQHDRDFLVGVAKYVFCVLHV